MKKYFHIYILLLITCCNGLDKNNLTKNDCVNYLENYKKIYNYKGIVETDIFSDSLFCKGCFDALNDTVYYYLYNSSFYEPNFCLHYLFDSLKVSIKQTSKEQSYILGYNYLVDTKIKNKFPEFYSFVHDSMYDKNRMIKEVVASIDINYSDNKFFMFIDNKLLNIDIDENLKLCLITSNIKKSILISDLYNKVIIPENDSIILEIDYQNYNHINFCKPESKHNIDWIIMETSLNEDNNEYKLIIYLPDLLFMDDKGNPYEQQNRIIKKHLYSQTAPAPASVPQDTCGKNSKAKSEQ
jgi:hypothetical protein